MTFADIPITEFAPILAVISGMLVGFYGIAKVMLNQATRDRDADRKERAQFVVAIKALTKSGERQALATERAAKEAEKRNGHLAEISMQNKDQIIDSIKGLKIQKQLVQNQTVQHEHVIKKD